MKINFLHFVACTISSTLSINDKNTQFTIGLKNILSFLNHLNLFELGKLCLKSLFTIIHSLSLQEVEDKEFEEKNEWLLSTCLSFLKTIFLLVDQLETMCSYSKHLKYLIKPLMKI